jgi:hypothetical protein
MQNEATKIPVIIASNWGDGVFVKRSFLRPKAKKALIKSKR